MTVEKSVSPRVKTSMAVEKSVSPRVKTSMTVEKSVSKQRISFEEQSGG
jgi:hypothetical protein